MRVNEAIQYPKGGTFYCVKRDHVEIWKGGKQVGVFVGTVEDFRKNR